MIRMFLRFGALLTLLLLCAGEIPAQTGGARKAPVRIIYSALTACNAPVWVGADQGLFEKYGLDVQIVHGRGASPIQALAGGTVELVTSPARRSFKPISAAAIWFLSRPNPIMSCCRFGRARIRR